MRTQKHTHTYTHAHVHWPMGDAYNIVQAPRRTAAEEIGPRQRPPWACRAPEEDEGEALAGMGLLGSWCSHTPHLF